MTLQLSKLSAVFLCRGNQRMQAGLGLRTATWSDFTELVRCETKRPHPIVQLQLKLATAILQSLLQFQLFLFVYLILQYCPEALASRLGIFGLDFAQKVENLA